MGEKSLLHKAGVQDILYTVRFLRRSSVHAAVLTLPFIKQITELERSLQEEQRLAVYLTFLVHYVVWRCTFLSPADNR